MRLLLIAALLCCLPAQAQEIASQGLVRHYDFAHSGTPQWPVKPTFEIDFSQDPSGATVTANTGQVLTKVGAPVRKLDGTYTDGISSGPTGYAHSFDGTNDYFTRADDGTFDPAGDFSVSCVITPGDVSGLQSIINKWDSGSSDAGWILTTSDDDVVFKVSSDGATGGATETIVTKASVLAAGRPTYITVAYDFVADGSSEIHIYVDGAAVESETSAVGPVHDSIANFAVGSAHGNGNPYHGLAGHCAYFDGYAFTAADHALAAASYRGTTNSAGVPVTISSASPPMQMIAPPDSGTEPFLVPMPANTWQVGSPEDGRGGLPGVAAQSNYVQRGTLETCTAGDFTGWLEVASAGTGSAAITCETGTMSDGATSVKMSITGTDSVAEFRSVCLTDDVGSDLYLSAMMKATGTSVTFLRVIQYDTSDCNTSLGYIYAHNGAVASDWTHYTGKLAAGAWDGNTSSYQVRITESGDGGVDLYADSIYIGPTDPGDWYCGSDTDASTVCTAVVPYDNSPISADGPLTLRLTASSPWSGTELDSYPYLFSDGSSGAANTFAVYFHKSTNEPMFIIYDSAGDSLYSMPNVLNWAANTDYSLQLERNGLGALSMYWNSTWIAAATGTGTGHRSASQSAFYFGGQNATTGGDVWLRQIEIYNKVMKP